jgi:hypothetical protein
MLARLPGVGEEQLLVVWTMVERWEPEAAAAAFWRALPDQLGTGESCCGAVKHASVLYLFDKTGGLLVIQQSNVP